MNSLSSPPLIPLSPYSQAGSRSNSQSNPQSTPQSSAQTPAAGASSNARQEVDGLDEVELRELTELKARDREVRAHEAAHQATGGQHAGAMSLTYQRGPDGAQYAVGGEVSISMSSVDGNPQATIEKMRTIRAAAMAPAEPSGQDRAVAAQAMQIMLQAQSEQSSRVGQQAKNTYQGIAGFGPESASGVNRLLSISV
ncbi:putative metalloprotease CJM1_0395 family protein [Marinobacter sp.]|uniref:putative metalloprotease CJM1_0395 family protein n=1 Tax=Marinobacter sp. TaxID=50741 RepID=UPI001B66914D|nr:putative metalloprotease CJM1_0395 family protein [Marinobacter sp.]MBQ0832201.1 hypothetical protein [Marinobacter sp.]